MSWLMDESYIKVKGRWVCLYSAVDKEGKTVNFRLSEQRDEPTARAFFEKAISSNGLPEKVAMNKRKAGPIMLVLILLMRS
jgi:putative transposase